MSETAHVGESTPSDTLNSFHFTVASYLNPEENLGTGPQRPLLSYQTTTLDENSF